MKTEPIPVLLIFVWLAPIQCFTYSKYLVNTCWDTQLLTQLAENTIYLYFDLSK